MTERIRVKDSMTQLFGVQAVIIHWPTQAQNQSSMPSFHKHKINQALPSFSHCHCSQFLATSPIVPTAHLGNKLDRCIMSSRSCHSPASQSARHADNRLQPTRTRHTRTAALRESTVLQAVPCHQPCQHRPPSQQCAKITSAN